MNSNLLSKKCGDSFTCEMGELIKQARIEAKMSQTELAQRSHFRQAAISQIESGKREVSTNEITYLSYALNKPITYFFPKMMSWEKGENQILTPLEKELLLQVKCLKDDDLRRLIAQARALVNFNQSEL